MAHHAVACQFTNPRTSSVAGGVDLTVKDTSRISERSDRFVAYTKPQSEWWLLLHYRDGAGVVTQSDCMSALKREDSNYRKGARFSIADEQVEEALERANRLHISRDATLVDLHERPGAVTTVHFLVQDLLNAIR